MNSYLLTTARAALLLSVLCGSGYFTFKYALSEAEELGPPPRGGCVTVIKSWHEYSGGGTRSETRLTPYVGNGVPIGNGMALETDDKPEPLLTNYVLDYVFSDGERGTQRITKEDYARTKTGDKRALTWTVITVRGLFSERRLWVADVSKGCK